MSVVRRLLGLLGWLALGLLVVIGGIAVGVMRAPVASPEGAPTTSTPTARPQAPSTTTPASPSTVDPRRAASRARLLLTNPSVAASTSRAELLAAAEWAVVDGDWAFDEHGAVAPAETHPTRRPLAVGHVDVTGLGDVQADLVWSLPVDPRRRVVDLRVLAASDALGAGFVVDDVVVDGSASTVDLDPVAAVLHVPVSAEQAADGEVTLRVVMHFTVPDRGSLAATEDPVGYGLLARSDGMTALAHWLPVPTYDAGPFRDLGGDLGAFAAATWSVVVTHPGVLVTGGAEGTCPGVAEGAAGCTWARGFGLRDLSAVLLDSDQSTEVRHLDRPRVSLGAVVVHGDADPAVADEVATTWELLHDAWGPLAWGEIDVVAVPLRPGAAGMELPGMIWVDPEVLAADGGFGSYVLTHEVAHQWFHALVGNSSLSDPVVDESLAQYGAYTAVSTIHGQQAADALDASSIQGRFERGGSPSDAPAQPLAAFPDERTYGAAVYGRGGHTWIRAEQELGRDRVQAFLRTLVATFSLEVVDVPGVVRLAESEDPDLAAILRDGWGVAP